jgi:hypothetical protein
MIRALLCTVALWLAAVHPAAGQPPAPPPPATASGTTVVAADMFFLRDASRTPMRRLPAGTAVRVLAREGAWLRVVYTDARFGDEVGYVRSSAIRLESDADLADGDRDVLGQRGFIEVQAQGFARATDRDPERLVADALWRQELQFKPAKWLQFSGALDLRANSHDEVAARWRIDLNDRGLTRPRLSVRTLSATISAGALSLDLGKQFVRWGKADILNPTDRLAPRDYLNVVDAEFLPIWAGRASLQLGEETVEAVFVPQLTPSRLPRPDHRWSVLPPATAAMTAVELGTFPDDAQAGVRWNHVGSAFEASASVFDGFNHLPDLAATVDPEDGTIDLTRTYPRLRTYGFDVAIPTRFITVKGEAAAFLSPSNDGDEYWLYVVELERQVGEWLFDGGYAGEHVTNDRGEVSFAAERGIAGSFIGRAAYTMGPQRSVAIEAAFRRTGDGSYVKGEYSQSLGSHWRFTADVVALNGAASDFLGQYRDNSHATAALRLSF